MPGGCSPLHLSNPLRPLIACSCCPAAATAALPTLRACAPPGVRVGAYANGFATSTSEWLAGGSSSDWAACTPAEEYEGEGGREGGLGWEWVGCVV